MSEHEKIRGLLALAAAGALTSTEEKQVADHVRWCMACSNELDAWRPLASDLCRLPTPPPSSRLLQATLARAQEKLAEQAEHDWTRRLIAVVVAFAWLSTIASWLLFHGVGGRFGRLLGPQFAGTWIGFAAFTALGWLAGVVAAAMLAVRQRDERRLV